MPGYSAKRWLLSAVRWRGRLGLVEDEVGEWLCVVFYMDAKGNHYRKVVRAWLSKFSTIEKVEPYVPIASLWAERNWEGKQRASRTRAQRQLSRAKLREK